MVCFEQVARTYQVCIRVLTMYHKQGQFGVALYRSQTREGPIQAS